MQWTKRLMLGGKTVLRAWVCSLAPAKGQAGERGLSTWEALSLFLITTITCVRCFASGGKAQTRALGVQKLHYIIWIVAAI
jgi:hypothetical protein